MGSNTSIPLHRQLVHVPRLRSCRRSATDRCARNDRCGVMARQRPRDHPPQPGISRIVVEAFVPVLLDIELRQLCLTTLAKAASTPPLEDALSALVDAVDDLSNPLELMQRMARLPVLPGHEVGERRPNLAKCPQDRVVDRLVDLRREFRLPRRWETSAGHRISEIFALVALS